MKKIEKDEIIKKLNFVLKQDISKRTDTDLNIMLINLNLFFMNLLNGSFAEKTNRDVESLKKLIFDKSILIKDSVNREQMEEFYIKYMEGVKSVIRLIKRL